MKMQTKQILLLLCLVGSLLSCEKIINMDYAKPASKLVLYNVSKTGEAVIATLSRTWFYTDGRPNETIVGADIKLYVNGEFREQMQFADTVSSRKVACYQGTYVPVAGDRITLVASAAGFAEVQATTQLPAQMPITDLRLSTNEALFYEDDTLRIYYFSSTLQLTLNDNPSTTDYYLISAEKLYEGYGSEGESDTVPKWRPFQLSFDEEPLFKNQVTALDQIFGSNGSNYTYWGAFSDELINGTSYTLNLPITSAEYMYVKKDEERPVYSSPIRFYLQAISADYFSYLEAMQSLKYQSFVGDLADVGLAEPIRVHSNVTGGTGMVGSSTCYLYYPFGTVTDSKTVCYDRSER